MAAKKKPPEFNVEKFFKAVDKEFGPAPESDEVTDWISTGSVTLNAAIGRPGYPVGKLTSLNGAPAAGKTTLVAHALAEAQKSGGLAALVETEYSYDPERFSLFGVDTSKLIIRQPETVELCFQFMEDLIEFKQKHTDKAMIIAWDTPSATPMKCEVDSDPTDNPGGVGSHARFFSREFRKLMRLISQNNVCLLFVNQLKDKIAMGGFGGGYTHLAYRPIRFHSSLVLDVSMRERLKHGEDVIGIRSNVRVQKSKVSPPYKQALVDLLFASGIDNDAAYLKLAVQQKLVTLGGSGWYELNGKKFRKTEFRQVLDDCPRLQTVLDQKIAESVT